MNSRFKIQDSKGSSQTDGKELQHIHTSTRLHISGEVIHGDHLGRKIGFPTANIELRNSKYQIPNTKGSCQSDQRELPTFLEDATYFVMAKLDGHTYPAAGIHMPQKDVFEIHILDFDTDIYGQTLQVDIVDKIRDNREFGSLGELKEQIEKDIEWIRNRLRDRKITR